MDSLWFPVSPGFMSNGDNGTKDGNRDAKASDETFSIDSHSATLVEGASLQRPRSISLSRQSSGSSSYSEETEDSWTLPNIFQTLKAELTGDFSQILRGSRHSETPPRERNKSIADSAAFYSFSRDKRHPPLDDDSFSHGNEEASGYTSFAHHTNDEPSAVSSFSKDDLSLGSSLSRSKDFALEYAESPSTGLFSPETPNLRQPESPSHEMRRLIFSASRSREPGRRDEDLVRMPFPSSPPPRSLYAATKSRSLVVPAGSSAKADYHQTNAYYEAGGVDGIGFAKFQTDSSNKENECSVKKEEMNSERSSTSQKSVKPAERTGGYAMANKAKSTSTCAHRQRPVLDVKSTLLQDPLTLSETESTPKTSAWAHGDAPFDEIDFFDRYSIKIQETHHAAGSMQPNIPFEKFPDNQPSSILSSPCDEHDVHRVAVPERFEQRRGRKAANRSSHIVYSAPSSRRSAFQKEASLPSRRHTLSPGSSYCQSKCDSPEPTTFESPTRSELSRSKSWREKNSFLSGRSFKTERSESFTLGHALSPDSNPSQSNGNSPEPSSLEAPRKRELPRNKSWRKKGISFSDRSFNMERSESFTLETRCTSTLPHIPKTLSQLSPKASPTGDNANQMVQVVSKESTNFIGSVLSNEVATQREQNHVLFSTPNKPTLTSEEIEVPLQAQASTSKSSRKSEVPRSKSWREKSCLLSGRSFKIKRSDSFTLGTKQSDISRSLVLSPETSDTKSPIVFTFGDRTKQQVNQDDFPISTSNKSTLNAEEIEVTLWAPNGCKKKKERPKLSASQETTSSPASVLDFPPTSNLSPGVKACSFASLKHPEGVGLGRALSKTIHRVSCRSTSSHSDSFEPVGSQPYEENDTKQNREATSSKVRDSANIEAIKPSQPPIHYAAPVKSKSPIERPEAQAMHRDAATARNVDTFDFDVILDDLLEHVGLGSLSLSPATHALEEEQETCSSSVIDAVTQFHI